MILKTYNGTVILLDIHKIINIEAQTTIPRVCCCAYFYRRETKRVESGVPLTDIFISHAAKDRPLVSEFIQLIEGGIGIRSSQIFCTSMEEQGVPPGVDFKTHIKDRLGDASVVIALVSPQYYNSAFCMCELGATWALTKTFLPILIPPVNYDDLRGSLFGSQAVLIGQEEKLDLIYTALSKLANPPESVSRWNSRKKQFFEQLQPLLKKLVPVKTLSEKDADYLKKERDEYKKEFEKADADNVRLRKQIAELEKAKDKKSVDQIKAKYSTTWKRFTDQMDLARQQISPLPNVVAEALYYRFRGEDFSPAPSQWQEQLDEAVQESFLYFDDTHFDLNLNHPKIKRALSALEELEAFLVDSGADLVQQYENRHDDVLDIKNRNFWKQYHLL